MTGVVLADGRATRLRSLTNVTNKHLLIYDQPLIYHALQLHDERVWGFMDRLAPSARGELEITDLNNSHIREGTMRCE